LTSLNRFLTDSYDDIILMSKKICRGSGESEEVAHFAMAEFMEHERATELVEANRAMNFLSGIIHRSFHSSTSKYHTVYRQKGRVHGLTQKHYNKQDDNIYSIEQDNVTDAIQGILEDMQQDRKGELYIRSMLFQMWIKESNFSELSRITHIPRTSIAQYVSDAKTYIQQQLKNNNITYE